ncbi:putative Aromatic compound dioxygenase [Seiridium unicorne]|uniref:Aromatic compound dioxygenase n=1 Tax=Seiridium unicorne TaxID=138068 RepID=A0ABR2UUP8_9PEZI
MRRAATVAKYRKPLYTDTPDTTIFASNDTCVLYPQGETGPYWVKGEYIRKSLREDQPGVPIVVEAQSVDVETCRYSGRTTHHHIVAHLNATVLPNNILMSSSVAHVGQIFLDQDIINDVEANYHYNTNNTPITPNTDDQSFVTEISHTTNDSMFQYAYIVDKLKSGSIAESGGTVSVDGGSGAGGAASGKNGTAPWGSFSGTIPSGTAVPSIT